LILILLLCFFCQSILGADSVNLDEFNATVFDQISNSYKRLPESPKPLPEPEPLAEPSIDSTTTEPSTSEPSVDEEDLSIPQPPPPTHRNEEEEDIESDYDDHESSTVATVRWLDKMFILKFVFLCISLWNIKNIFMMIQLLNMMMKQKL